MNNTQQNIERFSIIFPLVFYSLCFLYVWFWIKPDLIYLSQQPVYFFGFQFLSEHADYPGGLVEYASAFLTQFYIYPWAGALIITLVIAAISLTAKQMLKTFNGGRPVSMIHLVPAILLLSLHHNYQYPLSYSLSLLIALLFFNLYSWITYRQTVLRLVLYLFFCTILYYIAAGPFLVFSILCILFEILHGKSTWLSRLSFTLFYVLFAFLVPHFMVSYIFLISTEDTYTYLLLFSLVYKVRIMLYLLYLFFPVTAIILSIIQHALSADKRELLSKFDFLQLKSNKIAQSVFIFILAGVVAFISTDQQDKTTLQVGNYALHGRWNDILELIKDKASVNSRIIAFHMNRALYHTGRMSNEMFAFPQDYKTAALLTTDKTSYSATLENSDLMFELGHINSAQLWAYEALSIIGETPRILKRLTLIHILKEEYQVARKCLELLKRTVFHRKWAQRYMQLIDNPDLLQKEKNLQRLRSMMVESDFLIRPGFPEAELKSFFESKKQNRMAFEYLMAFKLLSCRLDNFIDDLRYLKELNYIHVPNHYEEAIILYMATRGQEKFRLDGYRFKQSTSDRFTEFMKILLSHGNDKMAARKDLMDKYGDTYWFYCLYNN